MDGLEPMIPQKKVTRVINRGNESMAANATRTDCASVGGTKDGQEPTDGYIRQVSTVEHPSHNPTTSSKIRGNTHGGRLQGSTTTAKMNRFNLERIPPWRYTL